MQEVDQGMSAATLGRCGAAIDGDVGVIIGSSVMAASIVEADWRSGRPVFGAPVSSAWAIALAIAGATVVIVTSPMPLCRTLGCPGPSIPSGPSDCTVSLMTRKSPHRGSR